MLSHVLAQSLEVTVFVAVMMIGVEYLNVLTRGAWAQTLAASRSRQYLLAVLLGATPGCLGAFAVVALYSHRMVSFGALVAAMIATSGDEAFVMLALFPGTALVLTVGLALLGWVAGVATDLLRLSPSRADHGFELHEEDDCQCFPGAQVLDQLREPSVARGSLALAILVFITVLATGSFVAPPSVWLRAILLGLGLFTLFVVLTVPDHFLEAHLWRHVVLQHVPRIFAWTAGALLLTELAMKVWPESTPSATTHWIALAGASLLGLIPESGPHLLFVTLFEQGLVPLSTLVASSIVQDGHGTLPLLAYSRSDFLKVKAVNLAVGLAIGGAMMALGS
ncbi:MAG: putative manganese transporter [Acidobacteriota bacterium]|jgi:hypothetical protein